MALVTTMRKFNPPNAPNTNDFANTPNVTNTPNTNMFAFGTNTNTKRTRTLQFSRVCEHELRTCLCLVEALVWHLLGQIGCGLQMTLWLHRLSAVFACTSCSLLQVGDFANLHQSPQCGHRGLPACGLGSACVAAYPQAACMWLHRQPSHSEG